MLDISRLKLEYITNEQGEKRAVVLPWEEFLGLLEDIEDLAIVAERRDEPTIPFEQVIQELKDDGLLSD